MAKFGDGGPAFPVDSSTTGFLEFGMSLCDWFAGQVLSMSDNIQHTEEGMKFAAKAAYEMADAMLAEKRKREGV